MIDFLYADYKLVPALFLLKANAMEQCTKNPGNQDGMQVPDRHDPLQDGISSVELIRVSGSDIEVVNAARVSYGKISTSLSERDKKLIAFLLEHNHETPFEHNQISFRIKAPIFVVRHWMRHRMHSYNEISYRYVKAPFEYHIPASWRYQDTNNKQSSMGSFSDSELVALYKKSVEDSYRAYEKLLEQGVCRELARCVLPLCTYTEFIFTSNLRALMHFLKLRLDAGAQKEIRQYATSILHLTMLHFPVSLNAWMKLNAVRVEDKFSGSFGVLSD